MIIDKDRLIFIHIPKNAGSSIKKYLIGNEAFKKLNRPWEHKTIFDIKKNNLDIYNDYRKFAIIRNPYDRMVSWFSYLEKYRLDNDLLNTYAYNSKIDSYEIIETVKAPVNEFRNWILNPYKDFNDAITKMQLLKNQYEWVDESVTILRYEDLNNELSNFFNKKIELPKINNTSRFSAMDYYDKKSLDIVYDRYKQDFEKFNYKKL